MSLRVRCKCGNPLTIGPEQVDRRIACAQCRKPFRISAEKYQAAVAARNNSGNARGSPGGVNLCPASPGSPLRAPQPVELDIEPVELELTPVASDTAWVPRVVEIEPSTLEFASAPVSPVRVANRPRELGDAIQAPSRGFWADAFSSFAYPVWTFSNAITFLFIAALVSLKTFLGFAGGVGLASSLIIFGWLSSVYLSAVQDTAAGSEDLPGLRIEHGWLDDIIIPAVKFIGAFVLAFVPAILLLLTMIFSDDPGPLALGLPVLIAIGVFFLPMILLLFSTGSMATALRPDQFVPTILRTILPYLGIWLVLMIVCAAWFTTSFGVFIARLVVADSFAKSINVGLVGGTIVEVVDVYLMLVAMRIIGLYYLHFKQRFTIVLE